MPASIADLTFFFGAGASAPFGIPTMKKMTGDFTNVIQKEGRPREQALYDEILRFLKRDLRPENVDIEAVFSVIEGLKEYGAESLGELSLYASRKIFGKSLLARARASG